MKKRYNFENGDFIEIQTDGLFNGSVILFNGKVSKVMIPKGFIDVLLQFIENPETVGEVTEFDSFDVPCHCNDFHCETILTIHHNGLIVTRNNWVGVTIPPYYATLLSNANLSEK